MKCFHLIVLFGLAACGEVNFRFSAPHEFVSTYSILNGSETRNKIGDREYLISHLTSIFGEISTEHQNILLSNPEIIGGKEDYYKSMNYTLVGAESNPVDMSARQALVIRVCHQLAQKNTHVINAVSNALGISGTELTQVYNSGPQSAEDIVAAYQLFFPGRDPSADIVSTLLDVADAAKQPSPGGPADNGWRYVFLTLCLDPAWQLL